MDNNENIELLCIKISQNSDQQAFKELYLAYFDRLYKFAFSILHSAEFAEEAVMMFFLTHFAALRVQIKKNQLKIKYF